MTERNKLESPSARYEKATSARENLEKLRKRDFPNPDSDKIWCRLFRRLRLGGTLKPTEIQKNVFLPKAVNSRSLGMMSWGKVFRRLLLSLIGLSLGVLGVVGDRRRWQNSQQRCEVSFLFDFIASHVVRYLWMKQSMYNEQRTMFFALPESPRRTVSEDENRRKCHS